MPEGLSDLGDDAAGLQVSRTDKCLDEARLIVLCRLASNSRLLVLGNIGLYSSTARCQMRFQHSAACLRDLTRCTSVCEPSLATTILRFSQC